MAPRNDSYSDIKQRPREVLIYSDIDVSTDDLPASKGYVDTEVGSIPALTDGDKGDIVVSSSGSVWEVKPYDPTKRVTLFSDLTVIPGTTGNPFIVSASGTGAAASSITVPDAGRVGVIQFSQQAQLQQAAVHTRPTQLQFV